MASIVVNARFKPFSYLELLAPVIMADLEHKAIDAELSQLNTKASIWENMANETNDPIAYLTYKNYSKSLLNEASSLATNGLTPLSRRNMLNMRELYTRDIVPIELAYNRRLSLTDEQRKLKALDNTMLFNKDASLLSLDELISNPNLSYESYSGSLLTKLAATAAANLARNVRDNPRLWRGILNNLYYETLMQTGFRPDEVLKAIEGNPAAAVELQKIIDDVYNSSGIQNWNNKDITNQAKDFIKQGLWSAVGLTKYETLNNKGWDYAMKKRELQLDVLEIPLPFSFVRNLTNNVKGVDVEGLNRDKLFINDIKKNPSLLTNNEIQLIKQLPSMSTEGATIYSQMGNPEFYNNEKGRSQMTPAQYNNNKLESLYLKYGVDNMKDLENKIDLLERTTAILRSNPKIEFASGTLLKDVLEGRALGMHAVGGGEPNSGLWKLKKGTEVDKTPLDGKELNKILESPSVPVIVFDTNINKWTTTVTPKGEDEPVTLVISPHLLDGGTGQAERDIKRLELYEARALANKPFYTPLESLEIMSLMYDMGMTVGSSFNNVHKLLSTTGDYKKAQYPIINFSTKLK